MPPVAAASPRRGGGQTRCRAAGRLRLRRRGLAPPARLG